MQVNAYLSFGGRCAEAMEFYKQHLNPTEVAVMPFRGSPGEEHVTEDWRDKVMHASLQFGATRLMGSDGMPGHPAAIQGCSIALSCDSDADAERIFGALAQGGRVTMPMEPTFWASRFGMLVDQFGVSWMVMKELPH